MRLRRGVAPIKQNGWVVLGDDEARALIRRLMDEGAVKAEDVEAWVKGFTYTAC